MWSRFSTTSTFIPKVDANLHGVRARFHSNSRSLEIKRAARMHAHAQALSPLSDCLSATVSISASVSASCVCVCISVCGCVCVSVCDCVSLCVSVSHACARALSHTQIQAHVRVRMRPPYLSAKMAPDRPAPTMIASHGPPFTNSDAVGARRIRTPCKSACIFASSSFGCHELSKICSWTCSAMSFLSAACLCPAPPPPPWDIMPDRVTCASRRSTPLALFHAANPWTSALRDPSPLLSSWFHSSSGIACMIASTVREPRIRASNATHQWCFSLGAPNMAMKTTTARRRSAPGAACRGPAFLFLDASCTRWCQAMYIHAHTTRCAQGTPHRIMEPRSPPRRSTTLAAHSTAPQHILHYARASWAPY